MLWLGPFSIDMLRTVALTFYELVQHAVDVRGSFVRHDPAARHDLQTPFSQQLPDHPPLGRVRAATVYNNSLETYINE